MWERLGLKISEANSIQTKPKAAFLTCGYKENLRLRLRNAAPSKPKAMCLKRGFRPNLKPHF